MLTPLDVRHLGGAWHLVAVLSTLDAHSNTTEIFGSKTNRTSQSYLHWMPNLTRGSYEYAFEEDRRSPIYIGCPL